MSKTNSPSERFAILIATWFGCGYSPVAPGTAGTLGALAIAVPLIYYAGATPLVFFLMAAIGTPPGIWAADVTAKALDRKDPGLVVVDEVLGVWLTLTGATVFNVRSLILAFCLFRIFDIWKPWPARNLESIPGGTGIVVDDLMAGIYGALVLYVAGRLNFY
jgi:phosphatidylglycerophosphatase A